MLPLIFLSLKKLNLSPEILIFFEERSPEIQGIHSSSRTGTWGARGTASEAQRIPKQATTIMSIQTPEFELE